MKKYLFITALLLTTGLIFAFTNKAETNPNQAPGEKLNQFWYDFQGGDETDPNRYVLRNPQTEPTCQDGEIMCAVKAAPHSSLSGKPDLLDPDIEERRED